MAVLLTSFATFLLSISRAEAFNCSVPPIYVDIHKREVNGTSVRSEFQYGSFIGVGTPSQNQSIWPSFRRNETSFAHIDFCKKSNLTNCETSTGGAVDFSLSQTWIQTSSNDIKDLRFDGESVHGRDTIHLWTHYLTPSPASDTPVLDASVVFQTSGNENPGILGLGSSSTLLQRLYDLGQIAGRTYSLYLGSGFDRAGGVVNGSNTFGGYDAGRLKGKLSSYKMDPANADYLRVTVSDITVDDPSNPQLRNVSIMNGMPGFDAVITTDRYPMLFPYAVTRKFISTLDATSSNYPDGSLRITRPFNGTLSIKLSDGFTVTLPRDVVSNVSGISPVANQSENYEGPFYLSASWLSEVYLMLDFEEKTFHLAQAVAKDNYVMPTPFCPGSTPVPYDYNAKRSTFLSKGLIGAVVGGIVGGSALLVLLFVLFTFWRRDQLCKRKAKLPASDNAEVEMKGMSPSPEPESPAQTTPQMPVRTSMQYVQSPTISRHSSVSSLSTEQDDEPPTQGGSSFRPG